MIVRDERIEYQRFECHLQGCMVWRRHYSMAWYAALQWH